MKLIVLDRDGVINEESAAFIKTPDEWRALPGSLDAIARLSAAGWTISVATNQSGVGRGLFDLDTLYAIHQRMHESVRAAGGAITDIFFCPHHPDEGCACRKPRPGLLHEIEQRFGVSLAGVPVVGDSARDLEAAQAVGARPILVLTGNGEKTRSDMPRTVPVEAYPDLAGVADHLLRAQ